MLIDKAVWTLIFLLGLGLFIPAAAGGRPAETVSPLAGRLACLAWERDGLIHAAVFNGTDKPLALTVSLGVYDTAPQPFASQALALNPGELKTAAFPRLERPSPRGGSRMADHVFIHPAAGGGLAADCHVQGPDPANLETFLAASNRPNRLTWRVAPAGSWRVLMVGRALAGPRGVNLGQVEPAALGPQPAGEEEIGSLDLPLQTRQWLKREQTQNLAYIFAPGAGGLVSLTCRPGPVETLATATVPAAWHVLQPAGGGGGGRGPSFFIYDPARVTPNTSQALATGTTKSNTSKATGP